MNQIIMPVIYTFGAAYATRTISEYIVGAVITKTTDVIVGSAKQTYNYLSNKYEYEYDYINNEYEYVDINEDDKIVYVTSKTNYDWDQLDIELHELNKKERQRKTHTKPIKPSPIYKAMNVPIYTNDDENNKNNMGILEI
jgi:hypothetical protein